MNGRLCRVIVLTVFCWTASYIQAQQMSGQQIGNGDDQSLKSSYFFYQRPDYPRDCEEVRNQCSSDISSGVYLIKPEGYPEPFEVFCDNENSESWMVIQRRTDGSIDFHRTWNDYEVGFGFLSREFWIGNEKLSYLTNQKDYELRINMAFHNGSSCYVSYNLFRISDGFGNYKLTSVGDYSGTAEDCVTPCPRNMEYANCTCQSTCEDPQNCHNTCTEDGDVSCICPNGFYMKGADCVRPEECGCHVSGEGIIVPEGEFYINPGCTRRGVCNNGQLTWDDSYRCSPDAVCEERGNVRQCYCNTGFTGEGTSCLISATDCRDAFDAGFTDNGVYRISPTGWPGSSFEVYCNMTDGGGWTVFQRRVDDTVDFYRNWTSYKEGFGSPDHEHWLGNDKLYYLTNQKRYTIRIDFVNWDASPYYAKFDNFRINDESDNYRLSQVGSYTGTAGGGSALTRHHNYQFTTYDRDNDVHSSLNCAEHDHGAWWYRRCVNSNLNGKYYDSSCGGDNIYWGTLPGSNCNKFTEMKVRPF